MQFRSVELKGLAPFRDQTIQFPPVKDADGLAEVHVFTGQNGTGKSRLLETLAATSVVRKVREIPSERFLTGLTTDVSPTRNSAGLMGKRISASAGEKVIAYVRTDLATSVRDVMSFAFTGRAYLASDPIKVAAAVPVLTPEQRVSFGKRADQSKNVCQGIANLKIQAAMDQMNAGETKELEKAGRWLGITNRLENAISMATGRRFAVMVTAHPKPEVKFRWGELLLPAQQLPDGLRSLLGWIFEAAIQMDMALPDSPDPLSEPCLFFLDEIEMHLHPAWQRKVLPIVQRVFPKAQIFVATHSPFMVASLNKGWIHRLVPDAEGMVTVLPPKEASAGDSYVSATADIFGIEEWFDPESEQELGRFRELRDKALHGDTESLATARSLAEEIAKRGPEIETVVGAELRQMEKQLSLLAK